MSDFIIQQGTNSGVQWPVFNLDRTNINFVGWSAILQIRTIRNNVLIHQFTTADNSIVLDSVHSTVNVLWTPQLTTLWTWKQAKYGLELTDPQGKIIRLDQGIVTLSPEVAI